MPLNYDLKKNQYLNTLRERLTHPKLRVIQSKMTLDTPVSTKNTYDCPVCLKHCGRILSNQKNKIPKLLPSKYMILLIKITKIHKLIRDHPKNDYTKIKVCYK